VGSLPGGIVVVAALGIVHGLVSLGLGLLLTFGGAWAGWPACSVRGRCSPGAPAWSPVA
jgi:hypothetical protein